MQVRGNAFKANLDKKMNQTENPVRLTRSFEAVCELGLHQWQGSDSFPRQALWRAERARSEFVQPEKSVV